MVVVPTRLLAQYLVPLVPQISSVHLVHLLVQLLQVAGNLLLTNVQVKIVLVELMEVMVFVMRVQVTSLLLLDHHRAPQQVMEKNLLVQIVIK